ncbi:amidohydrolase family protein [Pseudomonas syringae pv. actinidiae]|nr:amidohydrolase family protein [Pseudomonas syringae pv. actinidiae]
MSAFFAERALLPDGWASNVRLEVSQEGLLTRVEANADRQGAEIVSGPLLPGMPNLHSHAFQRAMAGLAEVAGNPNDSFWTWRDLMYRLVGRISPQQLGVIARQLYIEMLKGGYTSVAEFHYVHQDLDGKPYADPAELAVQISQAASSVGIGLTLLPVTIFMYRAQQGAPDPTLVFLPILLATSVSTFVGLLSVAFMQRLRLWDPVVLAYLIPGALLLGAFMAFLGTLSAAALAGLSSILGNLTLFGLIMMFLIIGTLRKVLVYEAFVEGAKEGFDVAKSLLPYLVAMLCAVGVLRASGALDFGLEGIRHVVEWLGLDTRFVDALPTAVVKPFSGSAARALLIETMQTQGVDSFAALAAATIQGSTETTFYVLAVYFGAVGIQRARHAVGCALLAEFSGVVAAIFVCYWFFGATAT